MKFTDGNWLFRQGFTLHYATEVAEAGAEGGALEFWVPTRPIRHRGDTLGGPVLTVRLTSPLQDVIRVQVSHFDGAPPPTPEFQLLDCQTPPEVHLGGERLKFRSGNLAASLDRASWRLDFSAGEKPVTSVPARGLALAQSDDGTSFMLGQLALGVGEYVYGLGERFTAFVKNGQVVDSWNRDGGTGSDQAYKNVPFYLTNRGYGVFVNHPERVSFEVASEKVSRVQFSVPGECLDFLVIHGPTPKAVLEKYTKLTGRPPLPPAWSFGLWLSTSFTTSYDEQTVTHFLDGMRERDLPLSVFHFDCFWMRAFRWCDFEWDPEVFPDPAGMLARLHARGLKVCVWINPYIAQRSPLFVEGKEKGYLLRRTDGAVWQWDLWQPGMAIVDFTNPEARRWYAGHLERLVRLGVDSFKTDFGERIPTEGVAWFDGSDPERMHNYYSFLYNKTVHDALQGAAGEGVLFARAATAGSQQFPVHWGGDNDSTFESMAESLRGGLSLGLSGFGFWSHDIGGFEGSPPPEVYKRWLAFGLLSSHSRLHGSTSYRVPWLFDDEASHVLRRFSKLKNRLMPYIYQTAIAARDTGVPVMRPMLLEFPDDPACETLDRQYLLGPALLVAPVFSPKDVTYYIPDGEWTDLFSERRMQGRRWFRESHDFLSLPLLVRPGTLLAFGHDEARADYDYGDVPTLVLYALADGMSARAVVPQIGGQPDFAVSVTRRGRELSVQREGNSRPYHLRLAGSERPHTIEADQVVLADFIPAEDAPSFPS